MKKYAPALPFVGALIFGAFIFWKGLSNTPSTPSGFPLQGRPVPTFNLVSLIDEKPLDARLFSNSGTKRWTLLNVWASWCSFCKAEHNFLLQLAAEKNIRLIGLNYRDAREAAKATLIATKNPYQEVIFDPRGSLALDLGSIVTPETYLIDPEGIIEFRYQGPLNQEVWEASFVPLLFNLNAQTREK